MFQHLALTQSLLIFLDQQRFGANLKTNPPDQELVLQLL